jgi:hypothetical protein
VRRTRQDGFTTIQYVVATAFSLLLFVMVANLLVDLYERGAVRDALDEGVRAGVPASASASGSSLRVDSMTCRHDGDRVVADARISLRSWFPMLLPDWQIDLRASAHREG